jgi:MarR family transcriptional regulator, organic hydroperoxide resistance regulator
MSLMIDGIATFTIVESTMIKATPRLMKTTPAQRLLSMLSNIAARTVRLRIVNVPDTEEWSLGRLLSTAARLIEHDWNAWLATHDLTHAGLLALHALEGGPLTQRQLAAASRVEEQTMSRVVARLERAGYVSRERDPSDRRRLVIARTPQGSAVFAKVQAEGVSDRLVERWIDDPRQFRAELVRLVASRRGDLADHQA